MGSFILSKARLRKFVTQSVTLLGSYFVLEGGVGGMKSIFSFFQIDLPLKYRTIKGSKF